MPRLLRHGAAAVSIALLITIATISAAVDSPFDEPTSECGEPEVVFAKIVDSEDRAAFLDLPAGVYQTRLIARGNVELESIDRFRNNHPRVTMVGWSEDSIATLSDREIVGGNTIFSSDKAVVATPGGVVRVSVTFG